MKMHTLCKMAVGVGIIVLAMGASRSSDAAVPWWANHIGNLRQWGVAECASFAAQAIQSVTGSAATTTTLSNNTMLIRGFTSTAGIFVECSASTGTACGRPTSDLSVTVFSTVNEVVTLRDQVSSSIEGRRRIDC